jgi:hypothetical protein
MSIQILPKTTPFLVADGKRSIFRVIVAWKKGSNDIWFVKRKDET